ncbi:MAG: methyltransferase, partial [Candidatus Brocadiia bacterium]
MSALRRRLGLSKANERVKVVDPFQMLGEVAGDLKAALGCDFAGLGMRRNRFGFENRDWKPWVTFDGTPVLVPGKFNTIPEANGDLLLYPEGDTTVPPSGHMPKDGFYFDAIVRQPPIDDATLKVEDNLEEFGPVGDEDLEHLRATSAELYRNTPYALVGSFGGTAFGDIALVPGPSLKNPKGIRDVAEWYISTLTRREHIREIFDRQCDIALKNLALI